MIVIFLIVLLLFGAKKLPELAKGMGQAIREFNSAKNDLEREINRPVNEPGIRLPAEQQPHVAASSVPPAEPQAPVPAEPGAEQSKV